MFALTGILALSALALSALALAVDAWESLR